MTQLEEIPQGQEEENVKILNTFLDEVQSLAKAQGIQITAAVTKNDLVVCTVHDSDRDAQYTMEAALLREHRKHQCACTGCLLTRKALGLTIQIPYSPAQGVRA